MTQRSRIEKGLYWDRAWKLVEGCTKASPGCHHCWSESESNMRQYNPNEKISSRFDGVLSGGKFNGKIRLREDNLNLPLRVSKPTTFAIWNDLFHEDVPYYFQYKAFEAMLQCSKHTFIVCTKRAELMKEGIEQVYSDFDIDYHRATMPLPNVILMVTAENQEQADKRIPVLLDTPAAIRGVSAEPLLSPLDLEKYFRCESCGYSQEDMDVNWDHALCKNPTNILNWAIIGAESGPGARKIDNYHIRELLLQCSYTNVPVFLKQAWINNKLVKMPHIGGQVWDQFPQ